ncbi:MAG TPA: hypothetical protein VMW64_07560 [Dehalococcoidia bacterium]|nr:hypothetical protein [Dehalococcoidia bacterium]
MNLRLANGKTVEASVTEVNDFITQTLLPNCYWRYSSLLTKQEVMRFLKRESSQEEVKKVARYMLTYTENLAFTAYLFDKSDGDLERTREFNMPAVIKLRELYQKLTVSNSSDSVVDYSIVNEMERICLGIGVDPL